MNETSNSVSHLNNSDFSIQNYISQRNHYSNFENKGNTIITDLTRVKSAAMLNQELPPIQVNDYATLKNNQKDEYNYSKRNRSPSKQSQPKQHKMDKQKHQQYQKQEYQDNNPMNNISKFSNNEALQLHRKNQSQSMDFASKNSLSSQIKDYKDVIHNIDNQNYNFIKENAIQHNNAIGQTVKSSLAKKSQPLYQSEDLLQESDSQIQKSLQEIQTFSVYLESFKKNLEYLAQKEKLMQIKNKEIQIRNGLPQENKQSHRPMAISSRDIQNNKISHKPTVTSKAQLDNRDLAHYYYLPQIQNQSIVPHQNSSNTMAISNKNNESVQQSISLTRPNHFMASTVLAGKEHKVPASNDVHEGKQKKITFKIENSTHKDHLKHIKISPEQENLRAFLFRQINDTTQSITNDLIKSRNELKLKQLINLSQDKANSFENGMIDSHSPNLLHHDPQIHIQKLHIKQKQDFTIYQGKYSCSIDQLEFPHQNEQQQQRSVWENKRYLKSSFPKEQVFQIQKYYRQDKYQYKKETQMNRKQQDQSIAKNKSYFEIFKSRINERSIEKKQNTTLHIKKQSFGGKKNTLNTNLNNDLSNIL